MSDLEQQEEFIEHSEKPVNTKMLLVFIASIGLLILGGAFSGKKAWENRKAKEAAKKKALTVPIASDVPKSQTSVPSTGTAQTVETTGSTSNASNNVAAEQPKQPEQTAGTATPKPVISATPDQLKEFGGGTMTRTDSGDTITMSAGRVMWEHKAYATTALGFVYKGIMMALPLLTFHIGLIGAGLAAAFFLWDFMPSVPAKAPFKEKLSGYMHKGLIAVCLGVAAFGCFGALGPSMQIVWTIVGPIIEGAVIFARGLAGKLKKD